MAGPTVFMVAADEGYLDRLNEILTDAGFSPVLWTEATMPRTLLDDIRPAVVLVDLDLQHPGDGWDVIRQLRADPLTAGTPVILTVGADQVPDAVLLGRFAPIQMLGRPLDPAALVAAVRRAAGLPGHLHESPYASSFLSDFHPTARHRRGLPAPYRHAGHQSVPAEPGG